MRSSSGDFHKRFVFPFAAILVLLSTQMVSAQTIDFESLVGGESLFGIDVNEDGRTDVQFSTTAAGGFNTAGPNPDDQVFATGLVLETSSISDPDIRVDFLGGATDSIQLGFALLASVDDPGQGLQVDVFDRLGVSLASEFRSGQLLSIDNVTGLSTFPEGLISVSFDGVASFALLDATATGTRFVIDDFSGTFAPAAVPEPSAGIGLALLGLLVRRRTA
ncbi:hypothetical protein N9L06_00710 [Mariniblastus sp.]|nr:hypothetical protein [Mariniblastus sp.]